MFSRRHLLITGAMLPLAACAAPATPVTPVPVPVPPTDGTPLQRAQAIAQAVFVAVGPLVTVAAAAGRVSASTAARWASEAQQVARIASDVLAAVSQDGAAVSFRSLSPAVNVLLADLSASQGLLPEDAKTTIASIQFIMPIALSILGVAVGGPLRLTPAADIRPPVVQLHDFASRHR